MFVSPLCPVLIWNQSIVSNPAALHRKGNSRTVLETILSSLPDLLRAQLLYCLITDILRLKMASGVHFLQGDDAKLIGIDLEVIDRGFCFACSENKVHKILFPHGPSQSQRNVSRRA
jgi:hypothetical protein